MDDLFIFYFIIFKLDRNVYEQYLSSSSLIKQTMLTIIPVELVNDTEMFWSTNNIAYLKKPITLVVPEIIRNNLISSAITKNNNNILDHYIYMDNTLCKILKLLENNYIESNLLLLDNFYYTNFVNDVITSKNNKDFTLYDSIITRICNGYIFLNSSQYDIMNYDC